MQELSEPRQNVNHNKNKIIHGAAGAKLEFITQLDTIGRCVIATIGHRITRCVYYLNNIGVIGFQAQIYHKP